MFGKFRVLLLPFALLYATGIALRNALFNLGLLSVYRSKIPVISVGNLRVGGTGKTPFTEWLVGRLGQEYKIAVVSRGYGRKGSGFKWVDADSPAADSGDEALQIKLRYPQIAVAVCESRKDAVRKIEMEKPEINLILLDDAFQHRYIHRDFNIVLTSFVQPYLSDWILPAGWLREPGSAIRRADVVVLTKCPENRTDGSIQNLVTRISRHSGKDVFISFSRYSNPIEIFTGSETDVTEFDTALAVSGIADQVPFLNHVKMLFGHTESLNYPDHVNYTGIHIKEMVSRFHLINRKGKTCIVTTEKDATKLTSYSGEFGGITVLKIPYSVEVESGEEFCVLLRSRIKISV